MIVNDSNTIEWSNEKSLTDTNVIDPRAEYSTAQTQPLRWNSILGLISFRAKGNFYIHSV